LHGIFNRWRKSGEPNTTRFSRSKRSAASDKDGVLSALLGYIYTSASRLQSSADGEWLRKGLAAASIENCSVDYRDVLLALAELYVAAEKVGIDPKPHFGAVAELSSSDTPQGDRRLCGRCWPTFTAVLFSMSVKTITGEGTFDELKATYERHHLEQRELNLSTPLRQSGSEAQPTLRTIRDYYTCTATFDTPGYQSGYITKAA
jgi:hypothetical protein